jgi:hypothetical protein
MRVLLAIAGSILCSCSSRSFEVIVPDLPSEVTRIAVLLLDDSGARVASSAIVDRGAARELSIGPGEGDPARLWIAGFDEASIARYGSDAELRSRSTEVEIAAATDAVLSPLWTRGHELRGSEIGGEISAPAPEITAAWLPECPVFLPDRPLIDYECSPSPCAVSATQIGCRIEVDLGACLQEDLVAQIDGRGEIHFSPHEGLSGCEGAPTSADAPRSITCKDQENRSCPIYFYGSEPSETFEVKTALVVPGPIEPDFGRPPAGYISGLAVLSDRVVISTFDGLRSEKSCADAVPSRFVRLDPSSLAEVSTTQPAGCVTAIEAARDGLTFFGSFRDRVIARFDADGMEQVRRQLDDPRFDGDHYPSVLAISDDGSKLVVAISHRGTGRGHVVILSAADLSTVAIAGPFSSRLTDLAILGPNELAVLDPENDLAVVADEAGRVVETLGFRGPCSQGALDLVEIEPFGPRAIAATAEERLARGVYTKTAERCGRGFFFEVDARPNGLLRLSDGSFAVAAAETSGDYRAHLGLMLGAERRILPGATPVGRGVVRFLREDQGVIYGATPWEGGVFRAVRIGPR